jgi:hypothetical protein
MAARRAGATPNSIMRDRPALLTLAGIAVLMGLAFAAVRNLERETPPASVAPPQPVAPPPPADTPPAAPKAAELALPHTDATIDGNTLTDETAWQGGAELNAGFERPDEERLRVSVSLLWGKGRLYAWFTSPHVLPSLGGDAVELHIAPSEGDEETVWSISSGGEPRLRREKGPNVGPEPGGRELTLETARFGVEQGKVDWTAETSVPLAAFGLRGVAGERFRVTLRRCVRGPVAAPSARSCVQATSEASLSADEPQVP